jgi:NAD(P)-dependent dehydrogenase (short-subunit alcohol dehydrogenase family)
MDTPNQDGQTAIVTGGAQGIGKGISRRLLTEGWRVVIADIDPEAGAETADELAPLGNVRFVATDVTREADAAACVRLAIEGGGPLGALVNNAGIAAPGLAPVEDLQLSEWRRMLDAHLTGCFLMTKHSVPRLRECRGAIVNIASTRALQSEPHTEAYAAAKGGIVALTHALAVSLGPAVRVNCISPGWIDVGSWRKRSRRQEAPLAPRDHAQHPAGRVGRPEDIAALAAFLISPQAGFITGQNLVADGGMTRRMIYAD